MSQPLIYSQADFYKQFYALKGSKIRFKTVDGEYEGIVQLILPKKQRVTFEHVHYVPTREFLGNWHVFFYEFLSYEVIEDFESSQKFEKWSYLSKILDRKFVNNHYRVKDLFNEALDESQSELGDEFPHCDDALDDFVLRLPVTLKDQLPVDTVILDANGIEFNQAISYISKQRVIGVSFDGPKISRFGKLSWICISSPDCVFLFDIESLGKSAFENGLKSVFEDKNIEKVIHDCRQPSDYLTHKHQVEISNVFDTQVADFIVNLQRYADKPKYRYVSSLDCCLVSHLNVPQEFLFNHRKHLTYAEEENFFRVRPVSPEFRNVLIKNALYLIPLRNSLSELMLNPFHKAVDVYLKVLSNASEPELLLEPSVPDKIPPALVLQGIQTVHFQEFPKATSAPFMCKFKDPISEKVINVQPPIEAENNMNENSSLKSNHSTVNGRKTKPFKVHLNGNHDDSPIVDQVFISDSRLHIDSVYHHLASNSNCMASAANVNVKPVSEYVSNITVKESRVPGSICCDQEAEVKSNESEENAFDTSLSETSVNSLSDSEDSWSQMRSAFGASCYVSEKSKNDTKGVRFLPAGMHI